MSSDNVKLKASSLATLTVARLGEMGAWLDAGTGDTSDDILLHHQQQTAPVKVGDAVKVFLYRDPKGRLTASMRVPWVGEGEMARVQIINVTENGAFVDIGAERGVFMPFAGMRGRPQVGEFVWVRLYTDKSGRLAVTMEVEDDVRRASRPATKVRVGDKITGEVYNYTDSGAFVFTHKKHIAFIDNSEMVDRPRVGATVTARVTYVRDDGRLNASLRLAKKQARQDDSETLLAVLRQRKGGAMPYGDGTSPEVIREKFGISKAAFKRALGKLLKEGVVVEKDGWTMLKR